MVQGVLYEVRIIMSGNAAQTAIWLRNSEMIRGRNGTSKSPFFLTFFPWTPSLSVQTSLSLDPHSFYNVLPDPYGISDQFLQKMNPKHVDIILFTHDHNLRLDGEIVKEKKLK